jgi:peptide-methionine (R)-S-oxide reductase
METEKSTLKTEEEWKQKLTAEQYRILRQKGTEVPFTGKYLHEEQNGMYRCAACGNPLFDSHAKFDSGTGWPSFDQAMPGSVQYVQDDNYDMQRTEILCARCGSHLGHLFDDGPTTTGKRYCTNSVCLALEKNP